MAGRRETGAELETEVGLEMGERQEMASIRGEKRDREQGMGQQQGEEHIREMDQKQGLRREDRQGVKLSQETLRE